MLLKKKQKVLKQKTVSKKPVTKVKAQKPRILKKTTDQKKILKDIKNKEEQAKIQEQKKLEIQKERTERYKNSNDPTTFYATNKDLMNELIKWRDSAEDVNERLPSEELGRMFLAIAYKLTNHSYFRNYPKEIKEDMISYAVEKFMTGIKNYNFKFTNPFAYFTLSCFNSFRTVLSKHYKQVNIKRSLMKKIMTQVESDMPGSGIKKCLDNRFDNDNYSEYD